MGAGGGGWGLTLGEGWGTRLTGLQSSDNNVYISWLCDIILFHLQPTQLCHSIPLESNDFFFTICLAAGQWLACTAASCQVGQGRVHSVQSDKAEGRFHANLHQGI